MEGALGAADRAVHAHPRRQRGVHRAADHPARSRLLTLRAHLGGRRLRHRGRRLPAARRSARRRPRPAAHLPGRCHRLRRGLDGVRARPEPRAVGGGPLRPGLRGGTGRPAALGLIALLFTDPRERAKAIGSSAEPLDWAGPPGRSCPAPWSSTRRGGSSSSSTSRGPGGAGRGPAPGRRLAHHGTAARPRRSRRAAGHGRAGGDRVSARSRRRGRDGPRPSRCGHCWAAWPA